MQELDQIPESWTAAELSVTYKPGIICESPISSPQSAYDFILSVWDKERMRIREQYMALFINAKSQTVGYWVICTGTVRSVHVDIRLIVALALYTLSSCVIVAHNHPSGKLEPSNNDLKTTRKLKKALKLIDITLWDHLIITEAGYLSIAVKGML